MAIIGEVAVLGKTLEDLEVSEARSFGMKRGPVPAILAKQHPDGYWEGREDFYIRTKYRGTVLTLLLLAELLPVFHQKIGSEFRQGRRAECHTDARPESHAGMRDERIEKACELLLRLSQDRESGGFAYRCSRAVLPLTAKGGGARLPDGPWRSPSPGGSGFLSSAWGSQARG